MSEEKKDEAKQEETKEETKKTKQTRKGGGAGKKKSPSKMSKQSSKGANKKRSKKKKESAGRPKQRLLDVGKNKWSRKKVGILQALQNVASRAKTDDEFWATKPEIVEEIAAMDLSGHQVNKFCHELAEEGYASVQRFEGDPNIYRRVTAKGKKIKLPLV